uniref:Tyrosinase copper-binding domain-containing protein n=1 Tax=Kalmanozyma brasiliensis (strain GHG001) TaxID=1365824 RepID=V5EZJ3_KALBG
MPKLALQLKAQFNNVTHLLPADPDHTLMLKLKCTSCHEEHSKLVGVTPSDENEMTKGARGSANLVMSCSFCKKESSAKFEEPTTKAPLWRPIDADEAGATWQTLCVLDFRGLEPCLGHHATAHADRVKVQSLLSAHPNPSDDSVWSQLGPKEWGFKGHDVAGGDTWTPAAGAAQTAKNRSMMQHRKLLRCVKRLQLDALSADPSHKQGGERALPANSGDASSEQTPQDAHRQPVVAVNDAQWASSSETDSESSSVQSQQVSGDASVTDAQKLTFDSDGNPAPEAAGKLAPGLGPDSKSVAAAFESDPGEKNMPKTVPGSTGVDASTQAGADAGPDSVSVAAPVAVAGKATQQNLLANGQPDSTQNLTLNGAGQVNNATNRTASPNLSDPNTLQTSLLQVDGTNSAQSQLSSRGCRQLRIRKEYSTLTNAEKKAFADAIKCVRSKPSRYQTGPGWNAADDWTLLHIRMVKYVHFTAYFLPFHRGFLAIVERDLNNCGFHLGLPWVDWTKTSVDPSTNALFSSDPAFGLGTNGRGDNSECPWQTGLAVIDGALANHYFNAPFRHRLCRQFNNLDVNAPNPHFGNNCTTFINPTFVSGLGKTHDNGRFFDFSSALEISTHLSMHTVMKQNIVDEAQ